MKLLFLLLPILSFGQIQSEIQFKKPCPYGYLEYIPTNNPKALLISLDGLGERGNGITELYKVGNAGIAKLIRDGQWKRTEFIIISPQLFTGQNMYSTKTLNAFIKCMIEKYAIDTTQIYIVGLSAGANSIYPYIATYKGIRGVIAISGYGATKLGPMVFMNRTKIWEFHGRLDATVPYSTAFHKAYVAADTTENKYSKFTGWPDIAHTGWQEVISGKWLNKISMNDPFNEDVFDWLLK